MSSRAAHQIAVIGAGAWGRNLVRNFHELGALAMVCDANAEALERVRDQYAGVETVTDPAAIWASDVAGVAIATPAATHASLARAALEAGKDVMVEKPLALDVSEGQGLVELAAERGRVLMVGHLLRYHSVVEVVGQMIRAGEIGRLRHISSTRLNFGRIRDEENILWSFAPHDISLILHFVGARPVRVQAMGGAYLNPHVPDVTQTHLEFEHNIKAHVHVSWLHPYKEQRLVVTGDTGMLVFDDQKPWPEKLTLYRHAVAWVDQHPVAQKAAGEAVPVEPAEPLRNECTHFLDRIADRAAPVTDGVEGLAVLEVLEAAQRSLDQGKPVSLNTANRFPGVQIHPTAEVNGPAEIGEGTRIWHFSKLLGPVTLGRGCSLGQNVVVERHVTLGDNVKVQNNVSIYQGVIVEDDVFLGPSMVFTNVRIPRSHVVRRGEYLTTRVRKGASIGANATVVCGVTLGRYAFVGAGAVVTRDVPDYGLVYGNPARLHGFACYCGESLPLGTDSEVSESAACPACGRGYMREGLVVKPIEP